MSTEALEAVKKKISDVIIQSPYPEEPFHSVNTLEWVLQLRPDADEALRVAALGHDIERAFGIKRVRTADFDTFDEYKQAHALNSAQILTQIMEECGVDQNMVDDVAHLVAHHETGGDEREDVLRDADAISFFHVCLPLFYDRKGEEITRKRCVWSYKKLPGRLRRKVAEIDYMDENLRRIVEESLGLESGSSAVAGKSSSTGKIQE